MLECLQPMCHHRSLLGPGGSRIWRCNFTAQPSTGGAAQCGAIMQLRVDGGGASTSLKPTSLQDRALGAGGQGTSG